MGEPYRTSRIHIPSSISLSCQHELKYANMSKEAVVKVKSSNLTVSNKILIYPFIRFTRVASPTYTDINRKTVKFGLGITRSKYDPPFYSCMFNTRMFYKIRFKNKLYACKLPRYHKDALECPRNLMPGHFRMFQVAYPSAP